MAYVKRIAFIPRDLILVTIVAIDWYCRPSGIITSAWPGQLVPAYVMFFPVASRTQRPDVTWGVLGHAARFSTASALSSVSVPVGDATARPTKARTAKASLILS